ncbi:MAG: phage terminase small subunit [Anaerotignum propionicum]|uniref:phage terminase small subunit n=1 Tax=Anaerotignum propionicum TaxID=28446 RepID=UPI002B204845|nr:phage terminase small subunit [Anaerotignum propionicum]MEA5057760.1 phage terminase small subunit [Anaerotignum propionicum]
MARERSRERDEACKIWIESDGKLTTKEVAEQTGVKPEQVRKWKSLDKWQVLLEKQQSKRKRGGQPGNKNAVGAGAPFGNMNAQTHGAYTAVRLADLPPEQRTYIENITLNTEANMRMELQLLIAKETDLQNRIAALENGSSDALYVDRVVEMRVPKGDERLKSQHEKLEALTRERDDLLWDMEGEKPSTKAKDKRLERLHREIAELQDKVNDAEMERENAAYKVNMQTVIKASAFERKMKLEAELNKTHGRIIKLLDSLKGYELECRRIRLEERKYNLAKQKLSGVYDINPVTGEIDDENDEICTDLEV